MAYMKFQFTPLREGRRDRLYADGGRAEFQFTPLREGRPAAGQAWRGYNRFQFTPLREGRPIRSSRLRRGLYFNSRPSARGDSSCPY